jgi:hypothetical protein
MNYEEVKKKILINNSSRRLGCASKPNLHFLSLVTEAGNLDRFANKLRQMIPKLLLANPQIAVENSNNIVLELITHQ